MATIGTPEVLLILFAAGLFIGVFGAQVLVCWLLYRANEALPAAHRKVESWQAFLLLIPLFNLFWNFVMFAHISNGLRSFFDSRNDTSVGDCGASIGLWFSICAIGIWVPAMGCLALAAGLALLVMYLMKISALRARVLAG